MVVPGVASQHQTAAWCSSLPSLWEVSAIPRSWLPPLRPASSSPGLLSRRHLVRGRALLAMLPLDNITTSTSSIVLLADIQSIRDGIRAIFLPGIALVTFTTPALLVGLLLRSLRDSRKERDRRGLVDPSPPPPPPPALNQQTTALAAKLIISIIIDLIGDGSFLIPGAGEGSDLLWAPISALLVRFLYQSNVLSVVAFLEEILPFTDIIPTATLAFIFEVLFSEAGKREQQEEEEEKKQRRQGAAGSVIDVYASSGEDDGKEDRGGR